MIKGVILFLLCGISIVIGCKQSNNTTNTASDTTNIIQATLASPIMDSLAVAYHDSTLKIIKNHLIKSSYEVEWMGRKVQYIDSAANTMAIDLSKKPANFELLFRRFILTGDSAVVNCFFKNTGITISYSLQKSNSSWNIMRYQSGWE